MGEACIRSRTGCISATAVATTGLSLVPRVPVRSEVMKQFSDEQVFGSRGKSKMWKTI